jgi:putative ABC transport system ATP-binding protein
MLTSQSVTFEHNHTNHFAFPDIRSSAGSDLLILGESGVGKTTFLHLIAGLLKPRTGRITLEGTAISDLRGKELDRFRGANIGMVFQHPHFIQSLSLEENLQLIQYLGGKPLDSEKIKSTLNSLGLISKMNENPQYLSQGEQQRAAIALAVINRPRLILADEPTSALDDKNCYRVLELLKKQIKSTKSSLIIITHDQRLKSEFTNTINLTRTISLIHQ